MGTNNIPQAVPNTVIPASDHNSLRSAMVGDHVPRNTSGNPQDEIGSLGQSSFRWLFGYVKNLFVGTAAQNISLEGNGTDLDIKVGGTVRAKIYQSVNFLPSGMITPWAGDTSVEGWLICHGQEVSRTTYAELYAVVGNRFGEGNGTTTFHVPDFRGRFLRGRTDTTSRDPDAGLRTAMNTGGLTGNNVGSIQDDEFESHDHDKGSTITGFTTDFVAAAQPMPTETATDVRGGSETRPKNAYVNYLIKI